ncbi:MAG: hypothetical protein QXO21_00935 [Candidatus Anstonellales archaeon]
MKILSTKQLKIGKTYTPTFITDKNYDKEELFNSIFYFLTLLNILDKEIYAYNNFYNFFTKSDIEDFKTLNNFKLTVINKRRIIDPYSYKNNLVFEIETFIDTIAEVDKCKLPQTYIIDKYVIDINKLLKENYITSNSTLPPPFLNLDIPIDIDALRIMAINFIDNFEKSENLVNKFIEQYYFYEI